ncbi:hypothetical protein [Macrococcus carouselicus]|uniref:Uncharacterized protein n=1 Tax=Macrococcus carouselicus TaxID=69969 RepID=A0A9Q8CHU7_9STAP|nr:hypothetical protein [Macrococcus carouselicus]TDM03854.1 hypothetical protein ERX40_01440 [Macrococcus carouselicus]
MSVQSFQTLVREVNQLVGHELIDYDKLRRQIESRDIQVDNPFSNDPQITAINCTRHFLGDKFICTVIPYKLLYRRPLIAVELNVISRETLEGIQSDLNHQVAIRMES